MDLSIEIKYGSGSELTYNYKYFKIDGPEDKFTLHIGQLQHPSPGRDNMAYHNGQPFSTYDKDDDHWSGGNCAQSSSHAGWDHGGGWWFDNCSVSMFTRPHPSNHWYTLSSISYMEMKARPKQCAI